MMKTLPVRVLTLCFVLVTANGGFGAELPPIKHVDAAGAAKLLKEDGKVRVIDIRTPAEFAAGHIKGATNVDFYAPDFRARLSKMDMSQKYLVHCASGGRSTKSLELFQKLGFAGIVHLDGGFKAWEKAGQAVEK